MTNSTRFYSDLKASPVFLDIAGAEHFHQVPPDWWVLLSDVEGSTQAIAEGRYKDVNLLGAAGVAILMKHFQEYDLPFVFGGDGMTLLAPPNLKDAILEKLAALAELSKAKFNLNLRVGSISVQELNELGHDIEIAKHQLTEGKSIAIFRGGGLQAADEMIKTQAHRQLKRHGSLDSEDLSYLSCRWKPIPSRKDCTATLIIQALGPAPYQVYQNILSDLRSIIDVDQKAANLKKMSYRGAIDSLKAEARLHPRLASTGFLKRFIEILISVIAFKWDLQVPGFNAVTYKNNLSLHSDRRKFDDLLRMVVDVSNEELRNLKTYLETNHQNGVLYYGLHESTHSLMTCVVPTTKDGDHIHFFDGDHGGYALAAKYLKQQRASHPDKTRSPANLS